MPQGARPSGVEYVGVPQTVLALRGSGPFNLALGSGDHEALLKAKGRGIANGAS